MNAPSTTLPANAEEARQTSGLTTRMILLYAEREGGRAAVDALLERCGMADREEQLRDENYWCSYEAKIRMFEAAAEVLDDPDAAAHIGESGPNLNVGAALKMALRAFGSPRQVYANIVRTTGKFTWAHRFELEELESTRAVLRYTDVAGVGYDHHDCGLNRGLLSAAPVIFGQAPARITHDQCAVHGAEACVYEVTWGGSVSGLVSTAAGWAAASGAALAASALFAPALLTGAAFVPVLGALQVGRRAAWTRSRRWESLEAQLREQEHLADRLAASLGDLVSDLRTDDVLDKITHHAKAAVLGKGFALLVPGDDGLRCRSQSGLADETVAALESWAAAAADLIEHELTLDDLAEVPGLAELTEETVAFGSLYSTPLVFRGNSVGVLLALAHGPRGFLPREISLLQSYAAQAAIALANANLVARLERLASQDPLTGLLNHREFHESLDRELERARRYGRTFSVVLMDLDDFKRVNDSDGHAEGDRVLRAVADELRACSRLSDVASRVGGDEFALILPETSVADATLVAERVQDEVRGIDAGVRISFGVAEWPTDGPTKDMTLSRADAALYSAKRARAADERARAITGAAGTRRAAEARDFEQRRRVVDGRLNGATDTANRFLAAARLELDLDIALLAEVSEDGYIVRAVDSAGDWLTLEPDTTLPLGESFCVRMLDGRIPSVVSNVQSDERVADMALVEHSDIASYVGVPVRLSDGTLYGTLCLLGRTPRDLGERDIRFAQALASLLGAELERHDMEGEHRRMQTEVTGVHALIAALDARDRYTGKHSKTVVQLSTMVARSMDLSDDEVAEVEQVALLHDIGKVGIPDSVLQKEGPLDEKEWAIMREHPVIGARIISSIDSLAHLAPLIRAEHERWDGAGYPDGLAGEEIPAASRIVFACDAYHAMTSDRPYRHALTAQEAMDELQRCAGSQFDPAAVAALVQVLAPVAG